MTYVLHRIRSSSLIYQTDTSEIPIPKTHSRDRYLFLHNKHADLRGLENAFANSVRQPLNTVSQNLWPPTKFPSYRYLNASDSSCGRAGRSRPIRLSSSTPD